MNSPLAHDDKGRRVEKLEVEDDEERLTRIHNTLNKLSSSDPSSTITPPGLPKFDFGNRTTYEVSPNSELLARLQSFLPQLEASNALLETQDPQTFNIELPTQDERYIEMNLGLGVFESKSQSNPTSTTSSDADADAEMDIEEDSTSSSSSSDSSAEGESETSSRESSTVSAEDVVNVPLSMFVRDLNKGQYDDSDSDEESEDELEIINTAFVPLPRRIKPLPRRTSSRSSAGGGAGGKGVGIVVLGAEEGAGK